MPVSTSLMQEYFQPLKRRHRAQAGTGTVQNPPHCVLRFHLVERSYLVALSLAQVTFSALFRMVSLSKTPQWNLIMLGNQFAPQLMMNVDLVNF